MELQWKQPWCSKSGSLYLELQLQQSPSFYSQLLLPGTAMVAALGLLILLPLPETATASATCSNKAPVHIFLALALWNLSLIHI